MNGVEEEQPSLKHELGTALVAPLRRLLDPLSWHGMLLFPQEFDSTAHCMWTFCNREAHGVKEDAWPSPAALFISATQDSSRPRHLHARALSSSQAGGRSLTLLQPKGTQTAPGPSEPRLAATPQPLSAQSAPPRTSPGLVLTSRAAFWAEFSGRVM